MGFIVPKEKKKMGLCYLELVTLEKLLKKANFEQLEFVAKSHCGIIQHVYNTPNEAKVLFSRSKRKEFHQKGGSTA